MGAGPTIGNPVFVPNGGELLVFLTWDDTFGNTTSDYDILLLESATGNVVASSVTDNNATQAPVEIVAFENASGFGQFYEIAILNFLGASQPHVMEMFTIGGVQLQNGTYLNFNTIRSSVPQQSDSGGGVVSVGAISASDPGIDDIEQFSSRGPANNGALKPDVAAIDGVSVTGAAGFPSTFFGTSAAAPHVAGLAVLLLDLRPDLRSGEAGDNPVADRQELRDAITGTAVDLGQPGPDNTYGSGRIDGPAAGQALNVVPALTLSVSDATVGEADGAASVDVTLEPASTGIVTVDYTTVDDTATAPADYSATSGRLVFNPGVTSVPISVPIVNDTEVEANETFKVSLSNPQGGAVVGPGGAFVTIIDDDAPSSEPINFDSDIDVQLNADGILVNWVSAAEEDGVVQFALTPAQLAGTPITLPDVRGPLAGRLNKRTHRVEIRGVPGGSTLFYNLVSGGVTFGPFSVTLPSVPLSAPPNVLSGTVRYPDSSLALECIVSMQVRNIEPLGAGTADHHSLWVNGITNGGGFTLDVTNLRGDPANPFINNNINAPFAYNTSADSSEITVVAKCDTGNIGETTKTTLAAGFTGTGYQAFDIVVGAEPAQPNLSIEGITVNEGDLVATLTVFLEPAATGLVAVEFETADGSATAPADYEAFSGNLLFAAGQTTQTIGVKLMDDALPEGDEIFTVALFNALGGAVIDPIAGTAEVTIVDNEVLHTISVTDVTVGEGDGVAKVTVHISPPATGLAAVQYATADGTATAPADYTPITGQLLIVTGETTRTLEIPITDDTLDEPEETFTLSLSNAAGAVIDPGSGTATVTIFDNDLPSTLCIGTLPAVPAALDAELLLYETAPIFLRATQGSFSSCNPLVAVGEASGSVTLAIFLEPPSAGLVAVEYATVDGTAVAPADYGAGSGTVLFAAGETTKLVNININNDAEQEGPESFTVVLSNPLGNAAISPDAGFATVMIEDDDSVSTFSIGHLTVGEADGVATLTVSLVPAAAGLAAVEYETRFSSAVSPDDYTAASGTLLFAAGETAKTIDVTIVNDAVVEPEEDFMVVLFNPLGAVISLTADTAVVTIIDDDATAAPTLSIDSAHVTQGTTGFHIPVRVVGMPAPGAGAVDLAFDYDPSVISLATAVQDVETLQGWALFPSQPAPGTLKVFAFTPSAGATGDFILFKLVANAVGPAGSQTPVMLTVNTLADVDGFDVPVGGIFDGDVTIEGAVQPTVSIEGKQMAFPESDLNADFLLTLDSAATTLVAVDYFTSDGTAVAGQDYIATSGTVFFSPGQTEEVISVGLIDDAVEEPDEAFNVTLTNPIGGLVIGQGTAAVTIFDDDATPQIIDTVVGGGVGDGGPATSAGLGRPVGFAIDGQGNIFIADFRHNRVRRVDAATGVITTVAGTGESGFFGDGGPATDAELWFPRGVAVDSQGNLYIADYSNNRVRRVDAATGLITTVAGTGESGFNGDFIQATAASLYGPSDVELDPTGNLFIADLFNHRVRMVNASNGVIFTVAGTGDPGFFGDGGPADDAQLNFPRDIARNDLGFFIADSRNNRVRRVDNATRIITTVAGSGEPGYSGDGGPATFATLNSPSGVAVDGQGNIFIADSSNRVVRKVSAFSGTILTFAGSGDLGFSGDGGPAVLAELFFPRRVAVDAEGNVLVMDRSNNRLRQVQAGTGVIKTVAGGASTFSGGPAFGAILGGPESVAFDPQGNPLIADRVHHRVRKVDRATGIIITVAGNGTAGFFGDDGQATDAALKYPQDVAVDGQGNIFIADLLNLRVRRVDAVSGVITTVAGNGGFDLSGDGIPLPPPRLTHMA